MQQIINLDPSGMGRLVCKRGDETICDVGTERARAAADRRLLNAGRDDVTDTDTKAERVANKRVRAMLLHE